MLIKSGTSTRISEYITISLGAPTHLSMTITLGAPTHLSICIIYITITFGCSHPFQTIISLCTRVLPPISDNISYLMCCA